jgi:hypothetical protein
MKNWFVKRRRKREGTALFWQEGINVSLNSFRNRHINVHIEGGLYITNWREFFVYGEPKPCDQYH